MWGSHCHLLTCSDTFRQGGYRVSTINLRFRIPSRALSFSPPSNAADASPNRVIDSKSKIAHEAWRLLFISFPSMQRENAQSLLLCKSLHAEIMPKRRYARSIVRLILQVWPLNYLIAKSGAIHRCASSLVKSIHLSPTAMADVES